jgi:hypothetical protein
MTIKMPSSAKPAAAFLDESRAEAFISGAGKGEVPKPDAAHKAVVNMRFDPTLLAKIDGVAKRHGISRTAWLHIVSTRALESGEW